MQLTLIHGLGNSIKWLMPIHRWTAVVTGLFVIGILFWGIAIGLGFTTARKAPSAVIVEIYQAAQGRRIEDFRTLLSDPGRVKFAELNPVEVESLFKELSHDFTTSEVTFLGIRNYGKHAVAGVMQDLTTGFSTVSIEVLVKEGRFWRVEWPVGEADWTKSVQRFDPYYRPTSG